MKRSTLFLSALLFVSLSFIAVGNINTDPANPKSERREIRENRRAERQAAMEREIDSIMIAKAWVFRPQTVQREPAGRMNMLSNPNFEVRVWGGAADVFLPYIDGYVPPYKHIILNYTLPILKNYIAVQTENGWQVTFKSSLFSASDYTFVFEINSKFGTTMLTVKNTWNNDVTYSGLIDRIY